MFIICNFIFLVSAEISGRYQPLHAVFCFVFAFAWAKDFFVGGVQVPIAHPLWRR
jgi:hypothetical protein